MKKAPILLTGGTGFIGHHLAKALHAAGYELRYLVRPSSDLKQLPQHHANDLFIGDLRDEAVLEDALAGCQAVVHAAALVSFQSKDAKAMNDINIDGTKNLVNAALYTQTPRLVYLSSVAALNRVSGQTTKLQNHWQESLAPTAYARSKFAAEREVWRGQAEGLSVAVLYPSTVIGSGDWTRAGSPQLFAKAATRRYTSAGSAGFVAVEDVVKAALHALENPVDGLRILLNAENLSWKITLERIATAVDSSQSLTTIGPQFSALLWPLVTLMARIKGGAPWLTKDLHHTAQANYAYDGSSYEAMTGHQYRSIERVIEETGKEYLKMKSLICPPKNQKTA